MKINRILVLSMATLATTGVMGTSFNSIEQPRTMAMGGAGVAVRSALSAPLYNPALLSITAKDDEVFVALPTLSARGYDPDDFIDSVDEFQDSGSVDRLDQLIVQANIFSPGVYTQVADAADELSADLSSLSGKSLQGELGGATIIAFPGKSMGIGLVLNGSVTLASIINYRDGPLLNDLTTDVRLFDQCLADNIALPGSCDPRDLDLTYVDLLTGEINFDPDNDLTSSGDIRGVAMAEFGVSFSSLFKVAGQVFSIGITPKYVQVDVFDYVADVDTLDTDDFDADRYRASYTNFNLDLGIAKELDHGITLGLSARNLISQTYQMRRVGVLTGNRVKIEPQARLGVALERDWYTLVADVDLTENKPVGFERDSQHLALGAELETFDWLQLRFGYRADLVNSNRDSYSIGMGFSPWSMQFDLALVGSGNELGGAAKFSFSF